jgi:hypothetical protein
MFRRYNRWWSRFDQPDPYDGSYDITRPQSFNRYAYVENDPVNFVDPTGLFTNCGQADLPPCQTDPPPGLPHRPVHSPIILPVLPPDRPIPEPGPNPEPEKKRQLDPNSRECQELARKIDNIVRNQQKRAQKILDNPQGLDLTGPGPLKTTIEGHREIMENQIKNLERRRQEYQDKCGGGPGGSGVPVAPPVVTPVPRSNPGVRMTPAPVPTWIPRFFLIPLIMMDPCLVYPQLCFKPNAD